MLPLLRLLLGLLSLPDLLLGRIFALFLAALPRLLLVALLTTLLDVLGRFDFFVGALKQSGS